MKPITYIAIDTLNSFEFRANTTQNAVLGITMQEWLPIILSAATTIIIAIKSYQSFRRDRAQRKLAELEYKIAKSEAEIKGIDL